MKNVQIFPTRIRKEANDKLTEKLFALPPEVHHKLVTEGIPFIIVEKESTKKSKEIVSPFWLELINEYTDTKPLTQFDRFVLAACISEWDFGNKYTTPDIIFRHITGKSRGDSDPSDKQKMNILKSIDKLMCTQIKIDMTEVCGKFGYNYKGNPIKLTSTLLPSAYAEGVTVNGQEGTVIHFLMEPPILTIARAKEQILTYDEKLLDIPNQHNSLETITVKNYVFHRIKEIILHRMTPTITLDDIFEKCRLEDADKKKKLRMRQMIIALMEHLKTNKEILDYSIHKKNNKFYAIKFNYNL